MSKKKLSELTELDVIDAAIAQIAKPGGYTTERYFRVTSPEEAFPGPGVYATCAIGGVEQALWRLTGRTVREARPHSAYELNPMPISKRTEHRLYASTMAYLNRAAARTRRHSVEGIEELTFVVPKRTVLRVFRAARRDIARDLAVK